MNDKTLFEIVNKVHDEESFLYFMNVLEKDRRQYLKNKSSEEWKNDTIEDFLECANEWGEASKNGLEYYNKAENPWLRCAQIFYMGKIYE
jgi:hypothetical protein